MDLRTADIHGAQPDHRLIDVNFVSHQRHQDQIRDSMRITDIEGALPKTTYDSLKVKTRHINPLTP